VNRTLTKKLMYILVVVAMLAMMIPMTVTVSAQGQPYLTMQLVNPIVSNSPMDEATPVGWNVTGSKVVVTANDVNPNNPIVSWSINNIATGPGAGPATFVTPPGTGSVAQVQGVWGDAEISANFADNTSANIEKKWGQIASTAISPPGSSPVQWFEQPNNGVEKGWFGQATITDTVTGNFFEKDNSTTNPAEGVILNWFLVRGDVSIPLTPGDASDLVNQFSNTTNYPPPSHVEFADSDNTTYVSVTDMTGSSSENITADGEEAVQVVVVPQYPFSTVNIAVTPEVTSYDFYTTEMEVVPQVRWAGEKIVLEKFWGEAFDGMWVKYSLQNQSVGNLEAIFSTGMNATNTDTSVWTQVTDGYAACILTSSDEGVADVTAAMYARIGSGPPVFPGASTGIIINQHYYTVYFLKLEKITLGDVFGKRAGENTGPWVPPNPWDVSTDNVTQNLNVSQDALLRANVKGWFMSDNPSNRPARIVDPTNSTLNGSPESPPTDLTLPAGRWILPDDWAALAGPNWQQSRLHWDIMTDPYGTVDAENPLGPYEWEGTPPPAPPDTTGSGPDVIGCFEPGIEFMTPMGWLIPTPWSEYGPFPSTVVPDGNLDKWDAPMPPAKVIFQIQGSTDSTAIAGYFKSAMKTDIYYLMEGPTVVYTNPFYQEFIPANPWLAGLATINNGGYDWNSWDESYGPYPFWQMINQYTVAPMVPTSDPSGHPTVAEVYSDNHGEAMIWLNGNWNLDLTNWSSKGPADIPVNTQVGTTTIQASADYPYSRLHQVFQSNMDMKTWFWGGQILGADDGPRIFGDHVTHFATADTRMVLSAGNYDNTTQVGTPPNEAAKSTDKVIWIWVTDRDGLRNGVTGATVDWTLTTEKAGGARINTTANGFISNYNNVTKNIFLSGGFLAGTTGPGIGPGVTDGVNAQHGTSTLTVPNSFEVQLFDKFWGDGSDGNMGASSNPARPGTSSIRANASDYLVAAIDIQAQGGNASAANVQIAITSHDFDAVIGQAVPGTLIYETNVDFSVIDALDDGIRVGDANYDGVVNMADVTTVEREILGLAPISQSAIVNPDGSVDMGSVVKIERIILGLP